MDLAYPNTIRANSGGGLPLFVLCLAYFGKSETLGGKRPLLLGHFPKRKPAAIRRAGGAQKSHGPNVTTTGDKPKPSVLLFWFRCWRGQSVWSVSSH